ncbi:hypothetical protein BGX29_001822, partial [Mortierella sp. GBA35]
SSRSQGHGHGGQQRQQQQPHQNGKQSSRQPYHPQPRRKFPASLLQTQWTRQTTEMDFAWSFPSTAHDIRVKDIKDITVGTLNLARWTSAPLALESSRRLSLPAGVPGFGQTTKDALAGRSGDKSPQESHQESTQPGNRTIQAVRDTRSLSTYGVPGGVPTTRPLLSEYRREGATGGVTHHLHNEGTEEEEEGNVRAQCPKGDHELQQQADSRGGEPHEEIGQGGQDDSSHQNTAARTARKHQRSGVSEESQKRKVSPGSLAEVNESAAKKLSGSLSVDMEFYHMGRRSRGLVLQSNSESITGGAVASTRSATESASVDTASTPHGAAKEGTVTQGTWTYPDSSSRGSSSTNRDAVTRNARDTMRPPTGTTDPALVLGQEGYYTQNDLKALYAHWEGELLSTRIFADTDSMEAEHGESSQASLNSKGKARKTEDYRDSQKKRGSKSSENDQNDEFGDEDGGEEDVYGDEDEDEYDEYGTSGGPISSKRKRLATNKRLGKGKGKLESDGKKRKKLKSIEDTRKHPCSKCGKRFSRPSQRDTHFLTHTGQKPHICTLCNASFNVASNLKRHARIHTADRRGSGGGEVEQQSLRSPLQGVQLVSPLTLSMASAPVSAPLPAQRQEQQQQQPQQQPLQHQQQQRAETEHQTEPEQQQHQEVLQSVSELSSDITQRTSHPQSALETQQHEQQQQQQQPNHIQHHLPILLSPPLPSTTSSSLAPEARRSVVRTDLSTSPPWNESASINLPVASPPIPRPLASPINLISQAAVEATLEALSETNLVRASVGHDQATTGQECPSI